MKVITMPDKKLTDKEIVKAFQLATIRAEHPGFVLCGQMVDIINRLQAENERLKNAYKQVAWERDIFAEDTKEEIKKDCSYLMLDIKTIKSEAYKECIEKVKAEVESWTYNLGVYTDKRTALERLEKYFKEMRDK